MARSSCCRSCALCPCLYAGGCGKTTLATLLFNRLAPKHQHTAFLELDINQRVTSQQLCSLLKQLGASGFNEGSSAKELHVKLQEYVLDKRVLLVVDNVWSAEQLDNLLPESFWQGSCVIVTSRSSKMPDSYWWGEVSWCSELDSACAFCLL